MVVLTTVNSMRNYLEKITHIPLAGRETILETPVVPVLL